MKLVPRLGLVSAIPILAVAGLVVGLHQGRNHSSAPVRRAAGREVVLSSPSSPVGPRKILARATTVPRAAFGRDGATISGGASRIRIRLATVDGQAQLAGLPRRAGPTVTYRHAGWQESFTAGREGLRHTIRIAHRPKHGRLHVRLAVAGAKTASPSGDSLVMDAGAQGALRYSGFAVTDRNGRAVPSEVVIKGATAEIATDSATAIYPVSVDAVVQPANDLTPADSVGDGGLPWSGALSGDGQTAVVANPGENRDAGSAWIFHKVNGAWDQGARLVPSDESGPGRFGDAVAISRDGCTVVVGGSTDDNEYTPHHPPAGAAWVFNCDGGWHQQGAKLVASDGGGALGSSVALSAAGDAALVAGNEVVGFSRQDGTWHDGGRIQVGGDANVAPGPFSVAVSGDGQSAVVGAPSADREGGAAWELAAGAGGRWTSVGEIPLTDTTPGERLGSEVSMSYDGGATLLATFSEARVLVRSDGGWTEQIRARPQPSGSQGDARYVTGAAMSGDGNTVLLAEGGGAPPSHALLQRSADGWHSDVQPTLPDPWTPLGLTAISYDAHTTLLGGAAQDR